MARRRNQVGTVKRVITLRLHPEMHAEIIRLLDDSPNKARLVAEALYALLYGSNGKTSQPSENDTARETVESLLNAWDF